MECESAQGYFLGLPVDPAEVVLPLAAMRARRVDR
jgi:hypothetical protein